MLSHAHTVQEQNPCTHSLTDSKMITEHLLCSRHSSTIADSSENNTDEAPSLKEPTDLLVGGEHQKQIKATVYHFKRSGGEERGFRAYYFVHVEQGGRF